MREKKTKRMVALTLFFCLIAGLILPTNWLGATTVRAANDEYNLRIAINGSGYIDSSGEYISDEYLYQPDVYRTLPTAEVNNEGEYIGQFVAYFYLGTYWDTNEKTVTDDFSVKVLFGNEIVAQEKTVTKLNENGSYFSKWKDGRTNEAHYAGSGYYSENDEPCNACVSFENWTPKSGGNYTFALYDTRTDKELATKTLAINKILFKSQNDKTNIVYYYIAGSYNPQIAYTALHKAGKKIVGFSYADESGAAKTMSLSEMESFLYGLQESDGGKEYVFTAVYETDDHQCAVEWDAEHPGWVKGTANENFYFTIGLQREVQTGTETKWETLETASNRMDEDWLPLYNGYYETDDEQLQRLLAKNSIAGDNIYQINDEKNAFLSTAFYDDFILQGRYRVVLKEWDESDNNSDYGYGAKKTAWSAASSALDLSEKKALPSPKNINLRDGKLSWENVRGAQGYFVMRKDMSTDIITTHFVQGNEVSMEEIDMVEGRVYRFQVMACGDITNTLHSTLSGESETFAYVRELKNPYSVRDDSATKIRSDFLEAANAVSSGSMTGETAISNLSEKAMDYYGSLRCLLYNDTDLQNNLQIISEAYASEKGYAKTQIESTNSDINVTGARVIGGEIYATSSEGTKITISNHDYLPTLMGYANAKVFKMELKAGNENVNEIKIPLVISLPIPSGVDAKNLVILHFEDCSKRDSVPNGSSFDYAEANYPEISNGMATFAVSTSDMDGFAFANEMVVESESSIADDDGKGDDAGADNGGTGTGNDSGTGAGNGNETGGAGAGTGDSQSGGTGGNGAGSTADNNGANNGGGSSGGSGNASGSSGGSSGGNAGGAGSSSGGSDSEGTNTSADTETDANTDNGKTEDTTNTPTIETKTNADGSTTTSETIKNEDGSTVITETTVATNGETESTTVTTDASGNVTDISSKATDAKGNMTEAEYAVTSGTNVTLESIETTGSKLVVAAKINAADGKTYTVTEIAKNAAKGNSTIKTVTIKNGIKKIGANAFANCKKLSKVTIGKNVTSIAKNTFKGDSKLKAVTLQGSKVTNIGKGAFSGIAKNAKISIKGTAKQVKKITKLIKKSGVAKTVKVVRIK